MGFTLRFIKLLNYSINITKETKDYKSKIERIREILVSDVFYPDQLFIFMNKVADGIKNSGSEINDLFGNVFMECRSYQIK